MRAEEFFMNNYNDSDIIDSTFGDSRLDRDGLFQFAEAYHKSKVEAIKKLSIEYDVASTGKDPLLEEFAKGWNLCLSKLKE